MSSSNENITTVVKKVNNQLNTTTIIAPKMDDVNTEGSNIWAEKGSEAAVKFMCTNPDGTPRSYADMRMMFG